MTAVRIGCGSSYAEDRVEPAAALVEHGELDVLSLDCLAERTLTHAQLRRLADPSTGYDLRLDRLVAEVVTRCLDHGTRFVANLGAANPVGAAERTCELLARLGRSGARVAVVTGDDVLDRLGTFDDGSHATAVSANAYLGAAPIVEALERGADVVIGGRIADASLFLGPLAHAHGWGSDAWDVLAAGQTVGHLLECGTYLTGGNWHDPPVRTVARPWDLGMPFADVEADGTAVLSKLSGTGGLLTVDTCKAQLTYEIGDPSAYLTPDVVVDLTGVRLEQVGPDRVRVSGAAGRPAPATLKVLVGSSEGHLGEAEVSFAGLGAAERAQAAAELVRCRLEQSGVVPDELRVDRVGVDASYGPATPPPAVEPFEVRLRVAARSGDRSTVDQVLAEVDALYMYGPAGAGGVRRDVRPVLGLDTCFVPRDEVHPTVTVLEVA
ncbi:MAG: DUF1446 domain-containing protein [Actinomycetota bacterium]|nr:DUF1446 domain-containing protein [Actinomycetota bacterium]